MDYGAQIKRRLQSYSKKDIVITSHAYIRMIQRQMEPREVIENLINPVRLEHAVKEEDVKERFDCYFGYSKTLCHRYVIEFRKKVVVITAVKINRRWQKIVEKKLKNVKKI